ITSPFEVGSSMLNVRSSDCLYLIIRHSNVRLFDCSKVAAFLPPNLIVQEFQNGSLASCRLLEPPRWWRSLKKLRLPAA
ncbi:MAG: hypothetical protein WCP55_02855, partial [Lentisphaerota bacterium]